MVDTGEPTRVRRPRQAHVIVTRLVTALLQEEREVAWALALEHLDATGSRLAVFADLLQPALDLLADLWYASRVRLADEGRAATTVLAIVRDLPPTPVPSAVAGGRCLLTALPSERHTLGLEMLRPVLEDDGWSVQMALNLSLTELLRRIRTGRPQFVGVTAGAMVRPETMEALIVQVRALGTPVLVGGQAFHRAPDLWRRLGATAWAPDLRVGLVLARRLCRRRRSALRIGAA